jgi:D-mannonate dehydratase
MRPQVPLGANAPDEQLCFIREMGIEYVTLALSPEEIEYDTVMQVKERFSKYKIEISDVFCTPLQKNKIIQLGLEGRDIEIDKFINMLYVLGKAGIEFTSVAWQPNGILRTGMKPEFTRGGVSMYADMDEINARPFANGRDFSEEEIHTTFKYFMDRVIPVSEETKVSMALHPNDPPVKTLAGVSSLVYSTETFKKALELANNSPALGLKLCTGCWLEAGDAFGDIMEDIKTFSEQGRLLCVHFRNVSSEMPYFEETLAEDGYANMYAIMKQLVACDSNAVISIDHAFKGYESVGGMLGSSAYPTGYLKGLMHAAEVELKKRSYKKY